MGEAGDLEGFLPRRIQDAAVSAGFHLVRGSGRKQSARRPSTASRMGSVLSRRRRSDSLTDNLVAKGNGISLAAASA
jgi:hypothetical protein